MHDGPGIRTTVFLTGCPLKCWWCHNPEGLGLPKHSTKRVLSADDTSRSLTGAASAEFVMSEIEKDTVFYEESGGGATFSGGEPLMQHEFLKKLLIACRTKGIHTAVDTSGYARPDVLNAIVKSVDLLLFDLKLMDDATHRKYTGVSNAMILANLNELLTHNSEKVVVRIPLVPGITDAGQNINDIIAFLLAHGDCRNVSLLPYHRTGEAKYERLSLDNKMLGTTPPSHEIICQITSLFQKKGFHVKLGG
jgi:pyruvate formate lyase activating enzyme